YRPWGMKTPVNRGKEQNRFDPEGEPVPRSAEAGAQNLSFFQNPYFEAQHCHAFAPPQFNLAKTGGQRRLFCKSSPI
ncbi:MAG: hypothetical protein ACLFVE_15115, partial [Chitinispirillaceae bacterium]